MESREQVILMIVVFTALFFIVVFLVVILMVINNKNRAKHRAEMAELELKHMTEVNQAEREATAQTMTHIGRELHDNVGQLLTVSKMGLSLVVDATENPDSRLGESLNAVKESIKEVRRLGRSLNTDNWQDKSLASAIEEEAVRLERIGLCKVHLQLIEEEEDLAGDVKIVLYRTFQEVVSNALKHSACELLTIKFQNKPELKLSIADNGSGFDIEQAVAGAGLGNIKRRCELIGFEAELQSIAGQGSQWTFTQKKHERV